MLVPRCDWVEQGLLATTDLVTSIMPELAGTAWEGCTVRHLLDMRAGTRFNEDYDDLLADVRVYEQIYLWRPRVTKRLPSDVTAYIATLGNEGPHGGPFDYRSILTDVLAWVKDRQGRYLWVNRAFLVQYSLDHEGDEEGAAASVIGVYARGAQP